MEKSKVKKSLKIDIGLFLTLFAMFAICVLGTFRSDITRFIVMLVLYFFMFKSLNVLARNIADFME